MAPSSLSSSMFCNAGTPFQMFCGLSQNAFQTQRQPEVGVQSLAEELNALSMQERNLVNEDIHGVIEVIEETPEFVASEIEKMKKILKKFSKRIRKEADLAFFLRPTLENDDSFFLLFLRGRRYDAQAAAECMCAYFTKKKELFGDALLVNKITLDHLTEAEIEFIQKGAIQIIRNRESRGKAIDFNKFSLWDTLERKSFNRYTWYIFMSIIEDDPEMQRQGIASVSSLHGIASVATILDIIATNKTLLNSMPIHFSSVHLCYDDPKLNIIVKGIHSVLPKEMRIRQRLHFGSIIETQHVLMTFGIDAHDTFDVGRGILSLDYTKKFLNDRQSLERDWKALQPDPSSSFVTNPAEYDVLMGRSPSTREWPGNLALTQIVKQTSKRYGEVPSSDRLSKIMITMECIMSLQKTFGTRFLERNTLGWQEVSDDTARTRVGQALRNAVKWSSNT